MGLDSLNKTTEFVEEQWGTEIANKFLDRLDERIEQIKGKPKIGPIYKQTRFRQLLIHPLITLYYLIEDNYISLVLVWANRQDPEELKGKLKRM
jgi:plasmid stabilization system protein ParE